MDDMTRAALVRNVSEALAEDIGGIDWTAQLVRRSTAARAILTVREPAVLCGRPWFDETLAQVDSDLRVD